RRGDAPAAAPAAARRHGPAAGLGSLRRPPRRALPEAAGRGRGGRPVRVLMLSQFYPPVIGGEERHVEALSQALAARGHCVSVATIAVSGAAGAETLGGVRVHRVRTTAQRLPA